MDNETRQVALIGFFIVAGLAVLMGACVRGCDNDRKQNLSRIENTRIIRVECLRAGRDPLACNLMQ